MKAINPATEALIREYPEHGEPEVEDRLRRAERAYSAWRRTTFAERSRLMTRVARLLRERRAESARLMTEEMGKPIASAEAEVDKCAANRAFYAEHAEAFLAATPVPTEAAKSFVRFDPLGPGLDPIFHPTRLRLYDVVFRSG